MTRVLTTMSSLGLNLVVARLRLDPRLRWLALALLALNEARGAWIVWELAPHVL